MRLLLSLPLAFLLTGCLTKELPSYNNYSLKLENRNEMVQTIYYDISLYVAQPKALHSLKTRHIIYTDGLAHNRYALSLWSDEATRMIQKLTGEYLAGLNQYKYVTTSKLNTQTDFTLYSELLSFQHNVKEKKTELSMRFYLKNNKTNKVSSQPFNYTTDIEQNNAQMAVKGLNESTNKMLRDVSGFVQKGIRR